VRSDSATIQPLGNMLGPLQGMGVLEADSSRVLGVRTATAAIIPLVGVESLAPERRLHLPLGTVVLIGCWTLHPAILINFTLEVLFNWQLCTSVPGQARRTQAAVYRWPWAVPTRKGMCTAPDTSPCAVGVCCVLSCA